LSRSHQRWSVSERQEPEKEVGRDPLEASELAGLDGSDFSSKILEDNLQIEKFLDFIVAIVVLFSKLQVMKSQSEVGIHGSEISLRHKRKRKK